MADPGWLEAWTELKLVHVDKSSTYGTDSDALANFMDVAHVSGQPPELYPLLRLVEKASRAVHIIQNGDPRCVEEFPDMASLALCCEALRRRRG